MALSLARTSLRLEQTGHFCDQLATDSVRSKLPLLSLPMSPAPVSREASRDFVALDRPFNNGRVQTANIAVSTSDVCADIVDNFIFMFSAKRLLPRRMSRHMSDMDETPEICVSDDRERSMTAVLQTSDAERASRG